MRHRWSDAEITWLRANIDNYSWNSIADAFNRQFNLNLTQSSIEHGCLRRGITHGRKHEHGFVAGESNAFSQTLPIGSERIGSRGRVFLKIASDVNKSTKNWIQKDRYVWELAYGKLSKDELLIHLDGDKTNCDLANLSKVSRAVNRQLATFGWFFSNPEMTLAAIRCCELLCAINNHS